MFSAFALDFERGQWEVVGGISIAGAAVPTTAGLTDRGGMKARLLTGSMLALLLGACSADYLQARARADVGQAKARFQSSWSVVVEARKQKEQQP
jgi:hypothetical protein